MTRHESRQRPRCWPSPTAAAPTTPSSRAWRTRWRPSGTPSALGYGYLETDVHVTGDGVLLAFHDLVLDRVTDRRGAIAGRRTPRSQQALVGGRERVPTLAELFDAFPHARFNIDLKSDGAVPALAAFISRARRRGPGAGRLVLASAACTRSGGWPAAGSRRRRTRWRSRPYVCSPALASADRLTRGPGARALQVPHRRGRWSWSPAGLVRRAHATGKQVHVWTIDDPAEMHELLDRGVDGLITDRTDILRDVLRSRGLMGGTNHEPTPTRPAGSPTCRPLDADRGAEGLVLVRLGQQCLRHDHRHRAVRAVHHHDREERGGRQPDQRARAAGRPRLAAVVPRDVLDDALGAAPAAARAP